MDVPVRAVYKDGQLHLLDPVNLDDGQEVKLVIIDERVLVREALSDLVEDATLDDSDIDEAALVEEVEAGFAGTRPLSEIIIEERNEGP